jgi:L-2-hydroxyglutarate oxidase LhgO
MLDEKALAAVEPSARTVGRALWSRMTAVVDPNEVLASLRADLEAGGRVRIRTGVEVVAAAGPSAIRTTGGEIGYGRLVNAAGAHCDRVARMFGVGEHYRLIPFKGIYRKLRKDARLVVNGNIYPVPDPRNPFLGVHFTRSVHGDVYLGPTAIPAFGRENYGILAGIDGDAPRIALEDAILFFRNPGFRSVALSEPRKYIPAFLHRDAARLVHGFDPSEVESAEKVGIRPQLVDWRTKQLLMDFIVERAGNTLHVLNPVSPAFTSSMELARQVVAEHF